MIGNERILPMITAEMLYQIYITTLCPPNMLVWQELTRHEKEAWQAIADSIAQSPIRLLEDRLLRLETVMDRVTNWR
jgi:hypothetical protein